MILKKLLFLTLASALISVNVYSQEQSSDTIRKVDYRFSAGTNIGGSSPVGIPAQIRKILHYNPALPFLVKAQAVYHFDEKWGVGIGIAYAGNGMSAKARVKGYKTSFNASTDPSQKIKGYYYGDISTNVKNTYLQIPVTAFYKLGQKWYVNAGGYLGFALSRRFDGTAYDGYMRDETPVGTKVIITDGEYDFRKDMNTFDWGITAGTNYMFTNKFFAAAQFNYGFTNIMHKGFESITFPLHNIYLNIGVGVKI